MPRVFDYEKITSVDNRLNISPMRYLNTISMNKPDINGTWVDYGNEITSKASADNCMINNTNGGLLFSGSYMDLQKSCEPHAYNAGNYYNYRATTVDGNQYGSICSRGWRLPEDDGITSYSSLLINYGIDYNAGSNRIQPYDVGLLNLPLSFLRSGEYVNDGSPNYQGGRGYYIMESLRLYFYSSTLAPAGNMSMNYGFSVRCVSR